MSEGWLKLNRRMLDWEWLSDGTTTQFFIYCLLKANHAPNKWRGSTIECGQFITSLAHIAADLGLSIQQVRTCIKKLKSTGEVTSKSTNKFTLISITSWEYYQTGNNQPNNQITNEQQTNNKRTTTNKNDKKEKNDKNEKNIDISPSKMAPHIPYQKIVDLYHQILPELPECKKLSTKRKGQIRQRHINDIEDVETWQEYFEYIRASNFLMGRVPATGDRRPFIANLEWLTNESNYCKIYEGKYHG